jgi:hypothetical protein
LFSAALEGRIGASYASIQKPPKRHMTRTISFLKEHKLTRSNI